MEQPERSPLAPEGAGGAAVIAVRLAANVSKAIQIRP